MILEVHTWLPDRVWTWVVDNGYTALAGHRDLPSGDVIELRLRKNTVVYALPPRRSRKQRGRPRIHGDRLPALDALAAGLPADYWAQVSVRIGGTIQERQVATYPVVWYPHQVARTILLVLIRDPSGSAPLTALFSTDLTRSGIAIVQDYVQRWPIEVTFHDVKQYLGGEDP